MECRRFPLLIMSYTLLQVLQGKIRRKNGGIRRKNGVKRRRIEGRNIKVEIGREEIKIRDKKIREMKMKSCQCVCTNLIFQDRLHCA